MKKPNVYRLLLFLVAGMGLVLATYVYHYRPLVRVQEWKATLRHAEFGETNANVFQMWLRPDWLFVEIPDTHRDGYKWFLVRISQRMVSVGYWPRSKPYLHMNQDWSGGKLLTHGKVNDGWVVEWNDDGVNFENRKFKIRVSRVN